ncbi:hypothetical protein [Actinoplanes flavus]|uniref:Uncharacterized protein n=1 Tax=Actinoplanes flavus TaxID=2820290 RepID=A0ABS3USW7_9ACTN|nr:hypothetical protein [Actinoplanes flavus]MBO3741675.1 hypothetical protein [Actinoplanes flavus]
MIVELPEGSWWDWELLRFDGCRLRLAAGYDLTYHHGLELVFIDVTYLVCPARFQDPVFREPTARELDQVRRCAGDEAAVVVAFDIEAQTGPGLVSCLIAADSVEVVHAVVLRRS